MDEMRNIVLQLAIEGKLVTQDESDMPSFKLIKKIKKEKEKLIKEGKIKKNHVNKIKGNESPFAIPNNWKWVRLNQITEVNPRNSVNDEKEVSFVPMTLIEDGYGSYFDFEIKNWKEIKKGYTHFAENDIGVAKITPCFQNRKSLIFKGLKSGFGAGTTELHIIRVFSNNINRKYLLYLFKTEWFIKKGISNFSGTAGQQRINTTFMKNLVIPLPPIKEQKRIVKKIDSIMGIIDKLEVELEKREDLVGKLGAI
jgi:type I restriction enzyme S subunit